MSLLACKTYDNNSSSACAIAVYVPVPLQRTILYGNMDYLLVNRDTVSIVKDKIFTV